MIKIRAMTERDRAPILDTLNDTEMFTIAEVEVALELIDKFLYEKEQKDYIAVVADIEGTAVGYICYGQTPATDGTYDIYWIAVSPKMQGQGVGTRLLKYVEKEVENEGGRLLIIETSSQKKYAPTQGFYVRNAYLLEAKVKDFYKVDDDKLIYAKRLRN